MVEIGETEEVFVCKKCLLPLFDWELGGIGFNGFCSLCATKEEMKKAVKPNKEARKEMEKLGLTEDVMFYAPYMPLMTVDKYKKPNWFKQVIKRICALWKK